jgi:hypothetical protein
MSETPYAGTYLELEDLARQINLYQGYADEAEKRRTEAIEKESRNIDFELDRVRKCQVRLRVLLQELGLVSSTPTSQEAAQTGAASVIPAQTKENQ